MSNQAQKIDIRLANDADIDGVVELTLRLAQETEKKDLDRATVRRGLQRLLDGPDTRVYVATAREEPRTIVGFVSVSGWEWSEWTATKFLWLGAAYVLKEWREANVVGDILDEVAKYAASVGATGFRSYVRDTNEGSKAAHRHYKFDESHYVVFEKRLN